MSSIATVRDRKSVKFTHFLNRAAIALVAQSAAVVVLAPFSLGPPPAAAAAPARLSPASPVPATAARTPAPLAEPLADAPAAAVRPAGVTLLAYAATTKTRRPRRLSALWYAERQAGKWYCWGGNGPSCFDCSGLVHKAYAHTGVWLPRTTTGMLGSRKLHRIPARNRRKGDLAFYGTGHVELVTATGTFGALNYGTRIGWHHPDRWWHPTMYFRLDWRYARR